MIAGDVAFISHRKAGQCPAFNYSITTKLNIKFIGDRGYEIHFGEKNQFIANF